MVNSNLLKSLICTIALCVSGIVAAQTKQMSHSFSAFDAIDVDNDFNVNVVKSNKDYSISLTVDDILSEYVQTYVKNHSLFIKLDKNSLPLDIKKLYKGRKSSEPVLNATVYLPAELSSVCLRGSSVLRIDYDVECENFKMELADNAKVKRLNLDASEFSILMSNKSSADIRIYADNINISAVGGSSLIIEQDSEKLDIDARGNCRMKIDGASLETKVKASASSEVILNGKSDILDVTTSGMTKVDALNLRVRECNANLSGYSKLYESASEKIHLSMSSGADLIFDGEPFFDIVDVRNATIQRYSSLTNHKK